MTWDVNVSIANVKYTLLNRDAWKKWLVRRTQNLIIVGLSLTGASNILGQDMNLVDALQCCLSRGWHQTWISGNVLYMYFHLCNENKAEPTLALKPRGDITRNPKQRYQWRQNRTCKKILKKVHCSARPVT